MASRTVEVKIVGDERDLSRAFKSASRDAQSFSGRLGSSMAKVTKLAGGVALALGGGLAAGIGVGLKSLMEHEKANAQLASRLKSTGNAANTSVEAISSLADAIEKKSGIDDVAIKSAAGLVLAFKNVKNSAGAGNDVFDRTIELTADLSAALGIEATAAAKTLGKALDDPTKAAGALRKMGVTLTEQQREQIKAMVEAGDVMGAQKIILGELETRYGTAAEAAGSTMAGRLQILKARLEEVAEKVASAVLPIFERLVAWVEEHWPQIQTTIEGVFNAIKTAIETVRPIIEGVVKTFAALVSGDWSAAWEAFKGVVADTATLIFDIAKSVGSAIWDGLKEGTSGIVGWLGEKVTDLLEKIRSKVTNALTAAKEFGSNIFDGLKSGVSGIVEWLRTKISDAVQAVRDKLEAGYNAAIEFGQRVFNGVKDGITGIVDRVGEFFTSIITKVGSFFVDVYDKAKSLGGKVKSGVVDGVTGVVNDVGGFISDIPGKIEGFFTDVYNAAKNLGGKILSGIGDALASLGSKMVGWVKTPVNAVISAWNNTGLPSFKIHIPLPGPVPDIDFSTPSITLPDIPLLADGGIVTKPTLAVIGEAGPEAVVPLNRRSSVAGMGVTLNVYPNGAAGQDAQALAAALSWRLRTMGAA